MKKNLLIYAVMLILLAACQKNEVADPGDNSAGYPMNAYLGLKSGTIGNEINTVYLDNINASLQEKGANYRVAMAELIAAAGSGENGRTVYSKYVGNKQLTAHFVRGDSRREWSAGNGTQITYAIDQTSDMTPYASATKAQATQASVNALNTWEGIKSTTLGLTRNDDYGYDIGYVAYVNDMGGSPYVFADIQLAGFRDINFESGILGVTFTFLFVDSEGEFTDLDMNGKLDVAFREIYFDPSWYWSVNLEPNMIDIESIALHEIGHGLSQAHFGTVFEDQKGNLKASPRAVMNALYFEPLRVLKSSDIGGHNSIWGSWR